jgi:hypothetical protein
MMFRVLKDWMGGQITHIGKMNMLTTGSLKKGELVELVSKSKQFPLVCEVKRLDDKNVTYQIVKEFLEEVEA